MEMPKSTVRVNRSSVEAFASASFAVVLSTRPGALDWPLAGSGWSPATALNWLVGGWSPNWFVPGWSMLFDANRKGNHPVEQHVAVAERHALYGNFKGALKELYKANNKIENDILTKAKVQSRIKQLREMEQSLKKLKI